LQEHFLQEDLCQIQSHLTKQLIILSY